MKLSSLILATTATLAYGSPMDKRQELVLPESAIKQEIKVPDGFFPVVVEENNKPVVLVINSTVLDQVAGNDKRDLERRKWQGRFMLTRWRIFEPL